MPTWIMQVYNIHGLCNIKLKSALSFTGSKLKKNDKLACSQICWKRCTGLNIQIYTDIQIYTLLVYNFLVEQEKKSK